MCNYGDGAEGKISSSLPSRKKRRKAACFCFSYGKTRRTAWVALGFLGRLANTCDGFLQRWLTAAWIAPSILKAFFPGAVGQSWWMVFSADFAMGSFARNRRWLWHGHTLRYSLAVSASGLAAWLLHCSSKRYSRAVLLKRRVMRYAVAVHVCCPLAVKLRCCFYYDTAMFLFFLSAQLQCSRRNLKLPR